MQTVCAGAMNLTAGPSWSVATFAAVIPARAAALLLSRSSDSKVGASWRLSWSERARIGAPSSSEAAIVGEVWRSDDGGRLEVARTGRRSWRGRAGSAAGCRARPARSAAPSEIDSWMNGRATSASAVKVASRAANICAWVSATGATSAAVALSARMNPARLVSGEERLRITGSSTSSTPGRSAERRVQRRPAPGERVAELEQVLLRGAAGSPRRTC